MATAQVTLPKMLNYRQVAERLGVNSKTIRRMVIAGDFPAPCRVGSSRANGRVAWPEKQLVKWLESRAS